MVSTSKILNDLNKYLLRYSIFKDYLESDVHDLTSQILSILIDFTQDRTVICIIFLNLFSRLLTLIALELEEILRNGKRQSFSLLKEFQIGQ